MQKIVLISIKPKFANQILFGVKKFEYRKTSIDKETTHLVLYMTAPVKKIVGIATVKDIHAGAPSMIWESTKHGAGIIRDFYRTYFKRAKTAYAIELDTVIPFNTWIDPKMIDKNFRPPQSFKYINEVLLGELTKMNEIKIPVKNNLIFLAGIHGVGKGYFCDKIKEQVKIHIYGASQLIREGQGEIKTNKQVQNIQNNQDILIEQIEKKSQQGLFILEGHFCLIDKENNVQRIPALAFTQLNPKEIFLLEESAENIQKNLIARDSIKYDVDLISTFLIEERAYAVEMAKKLNIPIRIISHDEISIIITYLQKMVNIQQPN